MRKTLIRFPISVKASIFTPQTKMTTRIFILQKAGKGTETRNVVTLVICSKIITRW